MMHAIIQQLSVLVIFGINPQAASTLQVTSGNSSLIAQGLHNQMSDENETTTDQDRIVGGVEVEPGEFPYVVSLKYRSSRRHYCGGSLLSLQHVLTACHCLVKYGSFEEKPNVKPPRSTEVYAGDRSIYGDGDNVEHRTGKKTIIYPLCKKNITGWHYDFGILITKRFNYRQSNIEPVPLPDFANRSMLQHLITTGSGISCFGIGWGSTFEKGPLARGLMKVQLEMKTQDACSSLINYYAQTHGSPFEFDNNSQICAYGGLGKDACQGDSGGPLSCAIAGTPMVLGVVSWGFGCARAVPAVYARIDDFKPWLEKVLQDDEATSSPKRISALSLILLVCLMKQFTAADVSNSNRSKAPQKELRRFIPNPIRIVGGEPATEGEFPFAVSLQQKRRFSTNNYKHFCGGSLLSNKHVLSACHCLSYRGDTLKPRLRPAKNTHALAGALDLTKEQESHQRRQGIASFIHPRCAKLPTGLIFDAGVLIVKPFELNIPFVEPMPREAFTGFSEYDPIPQVTQHHHLRCTAIGWGSTKERGPQSSILMKVDLNLLPQDDCSALLDPYAVSVATELEFNGVSQFCTLGEDNQDACSGDSGGALLCEVPGVNHQMLVAVASWGIGCARHSVPGIWSRIDVVEDFVNDSLMRDQAVVVAKTTTSIIICSINLYLLS